MSFRVFLQCFVCLLVLCVCYLASAVFFQTMMNLGFGFFLSSVAARIFSTCAATLQLHQSSSRQLTLSDFSQRGTSLTRLFWFTFGGKAAKTVCFFCMLNLNLTACTQLHPNSSLSLHQCAVMDRHQIISHVIPLGISFYILVEAKVIPW